MRMSKERYPITTLYGLRSRIDPTPDYQRPPAWSRKQKQLLIDTILRGYDIPKMYWQRLDNDPDHDFAVVDGQQRLRTLWEFCSGEFPLAKDADTVGSTKIAGKRYDDLDFGLRSKFDIYALDVVIVEDAIQSADEDEVRDMFLRLQNGTTLKAQEKRNAMPGQMRDFVKSIAAHPFFESCKFSNTRFTFDHVASQMIRLEMEGGPTSVRDSDLNRMYRENAQFDANGKIAKKVKRVLDYLHRAFPDKTPELERYNAITLYCLASTLVESYVHQDTESQLATWFIDFETGRRANDTLPEDDRDTSLIEYKRLTSYSTDAAESIQGRLDYLERLFFAAFPDIEPKDPNRSFSHEQRLAIFRRGGGVCQIASHCDGGKLGWGDWHADHIVPHVKGGKTVVSNGQIACPACNQAKGGG